MQDIVIIDQARGRGDAWAELLKKTAFRGGLWRIANAGDAVAGRALNGRNGFKEACPAKPALAFIHYRNDRGEPIALIPRDFRPVTELWYGAVGEERDKQKKRNICRALGSRADVENKVSLRQLEELLGWVFDRDCDPENLPALLKPTPSSETLSALSILCQGYLAAFAGSKEGQRTDDLQSALVRMRFSEMPHDFVKDVANRFSDLRSKAWWRSPFDGTNLEEDARIEAKNTAGGNVPTPILDLIKAILEGSEQQTLGEGDEPGSGDDSERHLAEANLVAKAFCEVEKLLSIEGDESLSPNGSATDASKNVTQQ